MDLVSDPFTQIWTDLLHTICTLINYMCININYDRLNKNMVVLKMESGLERAVRFFCILELVCRLFDGGSVCPIVTHHLFRSTNSMK